MDRGSVGQAAALDESERDGHGPISGNLWDRATWLMRPGTAVDGSYAVWDFRDPFVVEIDTAYAIVGCRIGFTGKPARLAVDLHLDGYYDITRKGSLRWRCQGP